jgi:hypothetical protein
MAEPWVMAGRIRMHYLVRLQAVNEAAPWRSPMRELPLES